MRTYDDSIQELVSEIIKIAIKDISKKDDSEKSNAVLELRRIDAIKWIESDSIKNIFSFENCCWILNIDPKKMRNTLKEKTGTWNA